MRIVDLARPPELTVEQTNGGMDGGGITPRGITRTVRGGLALTLLLAAVGMSSTACLV